MLAPKDGVIEEVEVHHIEDIIFHAEVVPLLPKRDGQLDLSQGDHLPVSGTIEWHQRDQLVFPNLHQEEYFRGEQV